MSTETSLPQSTSTTTLSPAPSVPPPEIDATLSRLSGYRNVRGVMILTRPPPSPLPTSSSSSSSNTTAPPTTASTGGGVNGGIVQSTGTVFEGESGRKYAKAVESVVLSVTKAVGDCDEGDELKLMRIRTKRHELIITPDEKYLLVVLQDPGQ
ncbi:hypothetical protein CI109_105865 [Kwoniella shandongensis]|uniref:Uncharacterized protein n=1 Tax=Kwoniella shandongensis TaxID=1734106 RepID=A0A5M6BT80_9TREE|nr:uncharacterized protein CI109_005700 [Kwoniella shandongensis]KAA5525953.1 hypothetical protein CI109_005700 [Kwoniella shandongensis]